MTIPREFTRCDECGGSGIDRAFRIAKPPCPSCSGSGLLPTEKLREDIEAAVDPFMIYPLEGGRPHGRGDVMEVPRGFTDDTCHFVIEGPQHGKARPRSWWRRRCKRTAQPGQKYCWQHGEDRP